MGSPGYDPASVTGQIASGEQTKSEAQGLGDFEFVP